MRQKQYIAIGILTVILAAGGLFALPLKANAQSSHKDTADMGWWKKARFGMFIHWGIYSQAAGYWNGKLVHHCTAEWLMDKAHLTRQQYATLASKFNPVDFNADRWVRMARAAGVKYIVITTKHHDGFCMFHTKATHYNVVDDTPWHKDPMVPLVKACKKYGIRFCTYYSVQDWHSPVTLPNHIVDGKPYWQPMRFTPDGGGEKYVHYMEKQVGELIRQYHPGVIWFDNPAVKAWVTATGEYVPGWTKGYAAQVFHYVRKLDPTIIINNRLGWRLGDFATPEQRLPRNGFRGNWEECMTMNWTWGYTRVDNHFKTIKVLITNLIKCANGGGNFLLNVGPTGKGVIPKPEVDRMLAIGKWLKVNGQAIYGSHRTPFKAALPFGYATQKPGKLFLEVTKWPASHTLVVPMSNKITGAYMLTAPNVPLKTVAGNEGQTVYLPANAPDSVASVVVLQLDGSVQPLNQ